MSSGKTRTRWIKRDDLGRGAIVNIIISAFSDNFVFNSTHFTNLDIGEKSNTEADVQNVLPAKGRVTQLEIQIDANTRNAITVVNVRINGIVSPVTVSIPATSNGIFRSPAGAVAEFKEEDLLSVDVVNSGTAGTNLLRFTTTMEYDN